MTIEECIVGATANGAAALGRGHEVGSLEPGKQATLLITTGTPIDMMNDIEQAYIQGRELDMNDIQKHFFQKYMEKIRQQMRIIS